ncbi:MAG: P-loop NTPase [Aquificota bacterium]|nr:P-loop NTPase [Aquificota bacterium]
MLMKALTQFLFDVEWGDLDYLILDLPPGTGDVQPTLAQNVEMSGALVVTTPKMLPLADVRKATSMFREVGHTRSRGLLKIWRTSSVPIRARSTTFRKG